MTDDTKLVRKELAELAEAVRELRDREVAGEIKALREEIERLRAEKPAPACCGHTYVHWYHWPQPSVTWTYPSTNVLPNTVICGNWTRGYASGAGYTPGSTYTIT